MSAVLVGSAGIRMFVSRRNRIGNSSKKWQVEIVIVAACDELGAVESQIRNLNNYDAMVRW